MIKNAITTNSAKKKMLLARAGKQALPVITQMVFGTGGVDAQGEVVEPQEGQDQLCQEIYRKDIDAVEVVSDTKIRYICTLEESELVGAEISEIALADAEGDLVAIKTFMAKGKDGDFKMVFKVNDTM